MKKLLTLLLSEETIESGAMPENAEILYVKTDEKGIHDALKQAKGAYAFMPETILLSAELQELFEKLDKTNADIVAFKGGCCIKTAILKGLNAKLCQDVFSTIIYAVFSSKSIVSLNFAPFELEHKKSEYCDGTDKELENIINDFNKCKAKLTKDVYSFAFDLIVQRLTAFYIRAMLAIRANKLGTNVLKDFDIKLKENIVLFLALEKRFNYANLSKLRKKDFKIDFFTNMKFKKLV